MYPGSVVLQSGTLVNITWNDVVFNMTASVSDAASSSLDGESFAWQEAPTRLEIVGGGATQTSLIAANQPVSLLGINATNTSTVRLLVGASDQVNVTLTGLDLAMTGSYEGSLGGSPLEGVARYDFNNVTLAGGVALGCEPACGAHGRCEATEAGGKACRCECGWGGATCETGSGFCSLFGEEEGAACPVAAPPPPAPAAPCTPTATCGALETYDAATAACECREGWGGVGCTACQTDASCGALVQGASSGQCSASRNFTTSTAFLSYQCSLEGTGLDGIIVPGSFAVYCNTSGSGAASSAANAQAVSGNSFGGTDEPYCNVDFALASSADNPLSCRASNCAFEWGTSVAKCSSVSCTCETTCPSDLQGVLDKIEGNPCTLSCDEATGECSFDIDNFFVNLVAPCTVQQCIVEGYTASQGTYIAPASTKDYNPVIAAVPLMALLGVVGLLTAYLLRHPVVWRAAGGHAAAEEVDGGALAALAPSIEPCLRWTDLHVSFPASGAASGAASASPLASLGRRATSLFRAGHHADILHGVSGVASSGELVALLGPSGSGKTSLLGALAGRQTAEALDPRARVRGRVSLLGADGRPVPSGVAFVPQDDALLGALTVEESVRYAALLRGVPPAAAAGRVCAVLRELGLAHVAASPVGAPGSAVRGVSGGERRRVGIAMQLVHSPAVLLLDEPTSGLDSCTALSLMRSLRDVARAGRVVLLSFHQPSPAMFSLLDRVYLVAAGRAVFGGAPSAAAAFFERAGLPCPPGTAIAEHMLFAVSEPESRGTLLALAAAGSAKGLRAAEDRNGNADDDRNGDADGRNGDANDRNGDAPSFEPSDEGSAVVSAKELEVESGRSRKDLLTSQGTPVPSPHACRLPLRLAVLFWRAGVDIVRNPGLLLLHWAMSLGMGIFTGCIFYQVGLDISGAQNRAGGLFFVLAFFAFTSLTAVDLFMNERRLVFREIRGGMYDPISYLITKASLDGLLLRAIPTFLYAAPFYPMMGLQSGATNVSLYLFATATFALVVGAFAFAATVGCSTAGKASLVMNVVLLVSLLVGGFFVNVASIPAWIRWLHYLSVFFYAYAALITNEVATLSLNFALEGYAAVKNVRGVAFLSIIGVDAGDLTRNLVILDCLYAGLLLIAAAILVLSLPRSPRLRRNPA